MRRNKMIRSPGKPWIEYLIIDFKKLDVITSKETINHISSMKL